MFEYLIASIFLFLIWIVIYWKFSNLRKEMLFVSLFAAPGGFLQCYFVPEYWNPHTLFDLCSKFGFDIESLLFSFATGGIASVLYMIFRTTRSSYDQKKRVDLKISNNLYYFNRFLLVLPIFTFIIIKFLLDLQMMLSIFIVMFLQLCLVIIVRRDLFVEMIKGSVVFTLFYTVFCLIIGFIWPDFFASWNHDNLIGVYLYVVPIEEIIWAFFFGTFASVVYKYVFWIFPVKKISK